MHLTTTRTPRTTVLVVLQNGRSTRSNGFLVVLGSTALGRHPLKLLVPAAPTEDPRTRRPKALDLDGWLHGYMALTRAKGSVSAPDSEQKYPARSKTEACTAQLPCKCDRESEKGFAEEP